MALNQVKLWKSYVGRGAPSNAAGERTGYGRTKVEAHRAAGHWANQAPWKRTKRVVVTDLTEADAIRVNQGSLRLEYDDERVAWEVCGMPGEFLAPNAGELRRSVLIRAGKYATAILDFYARDEKAELDETLAIERTYQGQRQQR